MDELQISGRRYLSSRRVAREHGYTSDYVGQLIRGGKLLGQKVGRAWYVEAASLDAFLGGEGVVAPAAEAVVVVPEPVEAIPEPVETPVVKVAEPEPQPEVVPEPVVLEVVEEAPQEVKVEIKKEAPVEIKKEKEEERRVPLHVASPVVSAAQGGLRYVADEEPALPQLVRTTAPLRAAVVAPQELHVQETRSRGGAYALAAVALVAFGASAFFFSTLTLDLSVEEGNAATAAYSLKF